MFNRRGEMSTFVIITIIVVASLVLVGGYMRIMPQYSVWEQGLAGQAELSKAEYSKKVAVQEALAKKESATLLAEAEVERAKGVAKANEIIGASLKENEDYLRYLWITDVAGSNVDKTVVYVPTETNLPILEATRNK
jgi:regulator of protease activity HflC (stomatin/prohibitin superfamily)